MRKIGYFFGVSRDTAKRTKFRVQGYMLYKNPTGSLPSHTNHRGINQEQVGCMEGLVLDVMCTNVHCALWSYCRD